MQRNHLFIKASGLHYYRRTKCRDIGREMNRSARRKMLRVVGIIMVVMLPVMLALWFAQLRAVTETSAQLRTFAELALDKTELVIQQVDLARDDAEKYQGKLCTPTHRQYMLNVVRGRCSSLI
jgi:sensor c-di-GMP phosphodiesterase-like protein